MDENRSNRARGEEGTSGINELLTIIEIEQREEKNSLSVKWAYLYIFSLKLGTHLLMRSHYSQWLPKTSSPNNNCEFGTSNFDWYKVQVCYTYLAGSTFHVLLYLQCTTNTQFLVWNLLNSVIFQSFSRLSARRSMHVLPLNRFDLRSRRATAATKRYRRVFVFSSDAHGVGSVPTAACVVHYTIDQSEVVLSLRCRVRLVFQDTRSGC